MTVNDKAIQHPPKKVTEAFKGLWFVVQENREIGQNGNWWAHSSSQSKVAHLIRLIKFYY